MNYLPITITLTLLPSSPTIAASIHPKDLGYTEKQWYELTTESRISIVSAYANTLKTEQGAHCYHFSQYPGSDRRT